MTATNRTRRGVRSRFEKLTIVGTPRQARSDANGGQDRPQPDSDPKEHVEEDKADREGEKGGMDAAAAAPAAAGGSVLKPVTRRW